MLADSVKNVNACGSLGHGSAELIHVQVYLHDSDKSRISTYMIRINHGFLRIKNNDTRMTNSLSQFGLSEINHGFYISKTTARIYYGKTV